MATGRLKGDVVNKAYEWMRISGLTSSATSKQKMQALERLEMLAGQWKGQEIDINYNSEDDPDLNTPHNVDKKYWLAMETALAVSMLANFGKVATPELMSMKMGSFSSMLALTSPRRQVQYPGRMPLGRGNRQQTDIFETHYPQTTPLPLDTVSLIIDDVFDYVEHFDSILATGETVLSYTIAVTPSSGLTVVSDSLTTPDVSYRVKAVSSGNYEIKIVATTSTGIVTTRIKSYQVNE